jgi:hypothetical protein
LPYDLLPLDVPEACTLEDLDHLINITTDEISWDGRLPRTTIDRDDHVATDRGWIAALGTLPDRGVTDAPSAS